MNETEKHLQVLRHSILRARYVQAHSLCQDAEALEDWATFKVQIHLSSDDQNAFRTRSLPPEEAWESLTTRARAFLLKGPRDLTDNRKILEALRHFAQGHEQEQAILKGLANLEADWLKFDSHSKEIRAYKIMIANLETGEEHALTDNELAFAWVYGRVLHADRERIEASEAFPLRQQYQAAVSVIAHLTIVILNMLSLFQGLLEIEAIPPSLKGAFSEPVVLPESLLAKAPTITRTWEDAVQD